MDQYRINYRENVDVPADAQVVRAHRVEGWSEDYAFFSHPTDMDRVTLLVPRSIVKDVTMDYDEEGRHIWEDQKPDN